ncbi:hypothetical protein HMPREF9016_00835 [Neisseria sp. oral taxon 014 str. F0314]|jgi:periplasmic protein|uniref:SIMPL domain-containing protein n=1 Tax=Neisseria oralis TaxID=1107316 RepID=A0ABW8Q2S1_9NEIS|nr:MULTISPECIES: SIMPL domain-containing protein [Neisseria]EFI24655.1 hypothetical protein HMPREF9016_00835 [Neisseria sp. oral taxon 014 str. F0314]RKV63161.1 MAG: DUF541 domain-containing protein [Neisseria sp.]
MLRNVLIASLIAAATLPAAAEPLNYNVVEFSESAGMKVPRDTMTAMFRIRAEGKERQAVNAAFMEKFNDFSRKAKKSAFKTELTGRNAMPRYQYNNGKRTQTGWEESAELKVESKDFAALNRLIAETQTSAEVAQTYFSVSKQKREEIIDQVSKAALLRFKERAQALTRTLGFSNYKIVKLNLGHVGSQVSERSTEAVMMRSKAVAMSMAASSEEMDNVSPGSEEISITVDGSIQM